MPSLTRSGNHTLRIAVSALERSRISALNGLLVEPSGEAEGTTHLATNEGSHSAASRRGINCPSEIREPPGTPTNKSKPRSHH